MSNFTESSRQKWMSSNTFEHINAGSLQRIADATEKMAFRYDELIREKTRLQELEQFWRSRIHKLERRVASLRGYITRLKKKK